MNTPANKTPTAPAKEPVVPPTVVAITEQQTAALGEYERICTVVHKRFSPEIVASGVAVEELLATVLSEGDKAVEDLVRIRKTPPPPPPAPPAADFAEKLRKLAEIPKGITKLPDGSVRLAVTVSAEMVPILQEWATGAGIPFPEYLQQHVEGALYAATMAGDSVAAS